MTTRKVQRLRAELRRAYIEMAAWVVVLIVASAVAIGLPV